MPNNLSSQLFVLFAVTGSIQSDLPQHPVLDNHRDIITASWPVYPKQAKRKGNVSRERRRNWREMM